MARNFCPLFSWARAYVCVYVSSEESPWRLDRRRIYHYTFASRPKHWSLKAPVALLCCLLAAAATGCGTSYQVTSTGSGSFQASTDSVEFGTVTVGQAANSTVTFVNQGSTDIQVSDLKVAGNYFTVTNPNSLPISVTANGGTYSVAVQFEPKATGDSTGKLTISTTSLASPSLKIKLNGEGGSNSSTGSASPRLSSVSCSRSSITGGGSDPCTVTLSAAAGSGGFAVSLSSNNSAVTVPSSVTVPAGATAGSFTAAVSSVTSAQTVTLTASARRVVKIHGITLRVGVAGLTLDSRNVRFGDVNLNTPSTQPVTLTSSGTVPLIVRAGAVSGTGFSISGITFPLTLDPGQSATLYIQFDPTTAGTATGRVMLTTNSSSGTVTIRLRGRGQAVSHQVDLTWQAPSSSTDPVVGYNIYRAISGSPSYQLLNSTVNGPTSYTDASVTSGTTYAYYVESVDASGNQSVPSNTFNVTIR